jgi:O-methyltransferase involved in polyketide biosynthesis
MTDHAERIGPTAHYTAYVWRRAGLPHAEHFATRKGAVLYWGFFVLGEWVTRLSPTVPSMRQFLEYRHRLIDAVVARERPGCVVELGAGLTRRAVTWAADRGVPGLELDLPAMAAVKRQRLARAPASLRDRLRSLHEVHDVDVLDPAFSQRLAELLRGRSRPLIVAEGLLGYFDLEPRQRVLAGVAAALRAVGGGHLCCDLHTAAAQARAGLATHALRAAIRGLTRRRRALDPFVDLAALHQAFTAAGFDHCHEEHPGDHVHTEPALARLWSPAHVILARVDPPASATGYADRG